MNQAGWGLLGPEKLANERRTRTLGVGAAVREFNDLAVPGMGNVFFGKQLLLAIMGVSVAERLRETGMRVQNIETANAVEALACWLVLSRNNWMGDRRLRGVTKMRHRRDVLFEEARKQNFYVTQPMRMSTVQPLHALNLVVSESVRFNAFSTAQNGRNFIEAACDAFGVSYGQKRNVLEHLIGWATGAIHGLSSEVLRNALSPTEPLPGSARQVLRGCLIRGGSKDAIRRKAILAWVDRMISNASNHVSWLEMPNELDEAHWKDLRAGALFFAVRDAAIDLLNAVEAHMGSLENPRLELGNSMPADISGECVSLGQKAVRFLDLGYDPTPEQQAGSFCRECLDEKQVIEKLVKRDDLILRLGSNAVIPGPAFQGSPTADDQTEPKTSGKEIIDEPVASAALPENISQRVGNMILLSRDLHGKLTKWLEVIG